MVNRIAIVGGTFDPVHNGHIETAKAIQSQYRFDSLYFLPCNVPVLKPPAKASNAQRIDMLHLAIASLDKVSLDLREIQSQAPSYTVDTLKSFRQDYPLDEITLILGFDAFLTLPQWHHWEEIMTQANLLVMQRPEYDPKPLPPALETLLATRPARIQFVDAGHYACSSTQIKAAIQQGHDVSDKLPAKVMEYIAKSGLYR